MSDPSLETLSSSLTDTPYSLDVDPTEEHLSGLLRRLAAFRARREALSRYRDAGMAPLRQIHHVREVYESNAIEGLGKDLASTEGLIRQARTRGDDFDIARYGIARSLLEDAHTYEVLGLHAARALANFIVDSPARRLMETDLRDMHALVLGDDAGAGRYKRFTNSISGALHQPPPPTDVPEHMRQLSGWLARRDVDAVLQATVAHAWLTHVHPFEDGNGRMGSPNNESDARTGRVPPGDH